MTFTHKPTGRAIRFVKFIRDRGDYGIALIVPVNAWSAAYMDRLHAYCDANGLSLDTPKTQEPARELPLRIDCGQNIQIASALFRHAWLNVFGLRKFTKYNFDETDILDLDELVDRPDYRRYTKTEYDDRRHAANQNAVRERGLQEFGCMFAAFFMLLAIGAGLASLGLAISTLAAIGEPPEWSLTIGPVTAAGSSASWKFLLFYLIVVPGSGFIKLSGAQKNYARGGLHFFMLALPVAVVALWIGA